MKALIIIAWFIYTRPISAEIEHVNSSNTESWVSDQTQQPTSTSVLPLSSLCPPDKSLYTKEDIKTMIDFIVKALAISESVNNSYYHTAVAVRNKHMNDFKDFLSWYEDRPKHLKHVIEDIRFLRFHIEPLVKRVADALVEYSQLQESFASKLNARNALLEKLNRYKKICENNCEKNNLVGITRRTNYNGYYCSSLEHLHSKISSKLREFTKTLGSAMLRRIQDDDNMLSTKIETIKNNLKDVALKEFGRTMYDILVLQDEYHHFIEDVLKIDADAEVFSLKQTNLLIDTNLLELQQRIEKYGDHCRTCNSNSLRTRKSVRPVSGRNRKERHHTKGKESVPKDLVDSLLSIKYVEIQKSTNESYSDIFKDLNSLLDADTKGAFLKNLKPIQDDVIVQIQEQRKNFEELKNMTPPSSIKKLLKLSFDSKQLLLRLKNEVEIIKSNVA